MKMRNRWALVLLTAGVVTLSTMDPSSARSDGPLGSIRGTYRLTFTGIILASGLPESGVGVFVADGQGRLTGTEVFNAAGHLCPNVAITATYTVDDNGLGTLAAEFSSETPGCSGSFRSSLVVLDGGNLVRAVSTEPGFVTIAEEWRRQRD
jgi:hypothetical protein